MIFEVYPAGIFQANCYIIGDEVTREAAIVDPGGDAEGIMNILNRMNLKLKYILLTHGHGDHIGAVSEIIEKTSCSVLLNENDDYLIKGGTKDLIPILRNIKLFNADKFIKENDIIKVGNINIEVIETPGHTPGSVSFIIDSVVLTGDALFQGSIGRTDFPFGSQKTLIDSIKSKLFVLPDQVKVYPGHGMPTTIGYEKIYNPFF